MDRWTVRAEGEKRRTDIGKEVDGEHESQKKPGLHVEVIRERGQWAPGGVSRSGQTELLGGGVSP